jgi:hypothetical protein
MASSNYVVRDIVQYIHDDREYGTRHSLSGVLDKLKANFWIFIIIVAVSGIVGYLAVQLPGMVDQQEARLESANGGTKDLREKFNRLPADQKAEIMKQFNGSLDEKGHQ